MRLRTGYTPPLLDSSEGKAEAEAADNFESVDLGDVDELL